jgi:SagB-type dehydrogenase family enzyme
MNQTMGLETDSTKLRRLSTMKPTRYSHAELRTDYFNNWTEIQTDQKLNLPFPPIQKPYPTDAPLIDLPDPERLELKPVTVFEAIKNRCSHRKYTSHPLTLNELAFLCWATQGVKVVAPSRVNSLRTVPSAGARHPFETYLSVLNVDGLQVGLYRYLAIEHKLYFLQEIDDLPNKLSQYCSDFSRECAVVFIWTVIPYQTSWRYGPISNKLISQDSGHLCQNLYLACEVIGAGTCAVGAYRQDAIDALIGVDVEDEMTIYSAPVGKVE